MMTLLAVVLQTGVELAAADGLNGFAWFFMLGSMTAVTFLTGWTFFRIFRGKRHFDPDGAGPAHSPISGEAERP